MVVLSKVRVKGGPLVGISVYGSPKPFQAAKKANSKDHPRCALQATLHTYCAPLNSNGRHWSTLESGSLGLLMFNLTVAHVWNPEAREGRVEVSLLS